MYSNTEYGDTRHDSTTVSAGRSVVATVLLNLTGLALGYAYLGRWWRFGLHLLGTLALVTVAFLTGASDVPWVWRVVGVLWLAWMALDGGWLAHRTGRPARQLWPVVVGVVALVAVVGGYVGYGLAGHSTYLTGVEAQGRADCATAVSAFDTVTGPYELTLSADVPAAAGRTAECTSFTAARDAETAGSFADAVARYQAFRRDSPDSTLVPFVHTSLERTYDTWATSLRRANDPAAAVPVYRELLAETGSEPGAAKVRSDLAATYLEQAAGIRAGWAAQTGQARADVARSAFDLLLTVRREFADTPQAATVPKAMTDTFTAADTQFAGKQYCASLPVLDYAVTLPAAETAGVVGTANAHRASALLQCGLAEYRAGRMPGAITQFDKLAKVYPNDAGTAQARSGSIAAKVSQSAGVPIPLPEPIGGNTPGSIPVTYYNLTPRPAHVLTAGPTAHDFVVAPCAGCPQTYPVTATGCSAADRAGKPTVTLRLRPGQYRDLFTSTTPDSIADGDSVRSITGGFEYFACLRTKKPTGPLDLVAPVVPNA